MAELSVPVEELLRTAGPIAWPEALALVQGLIGARAGEPGRARLEADGDILAEPGPLPTVTALAQLLQALLPPPGTPSDPRVPAALRYSLIRATGGVTAPPFVSVEDFSRTLQRFEQGDRRQLLRALFERRKSPANAQASPPARQLPGRQTAATTPVTRPPAAGSPRTANSTDAGSRVPTPPISSVVAPGASAVMPAASPVRPAASPAAAAPLASAVRPTASAVPQKGSPVTPTASPVGPAASPVEWDSWPLEGRAGRRARPEAATGRREKAGRVVVATPPAPRARRRAGPLLSTVVALSLLIAGAVVGAAVFVHADGRPPSAILDALAPKVKQAKDWMTGLRASLGKQDETDRSAGRATAGEPPATPPDTSASATGRQRDGQEPQGAMPAAPRVDQNGAGSNADQAAAPPRFDAAAPPRPSETGTRGTSGATSGTPPAEGTPLPDVASPSGTAAATAPTPDPATDTSLPGQLVVALDVGRKPVFSPSFASDGTAVFYDEDSGAAGSALKEARAGSDKLLHVLSVLDDGARNYHPQLSPNGTTVAFDSDRDGVRGVYLSNRAGGDIRRVSGDGYAAVPSWSPDGRRLAFIKAEPDNPRVWNVWTLDVASGAMRQLTNHHVGQPWGASWFPDGRRICYSHEDRLIVLDTRSGASRVYPSPRKGILVRTPAVSPDGRRVIFQLYRHGAWMLDLDDGSMRQVLDDPTAEEFAWSPDGSRVAFHSRREKQWGIRLLSPNPYPSR